MVDFIDVYKSYGGKTLFSGASFRVNAGDRIGIVGSNGAGKSTLFGLITGEILPDRGRIALPKNLRIGFLPQQLPAVRQDGLSLLDFTADAIPELNKIAAELHELEQRLHSGAPDAAARKSMLQRHGQLQSAMEQLGAYRLKTEAEAALCSLGFHMNEMTLPLENFSGGWQMRAALARTLIARPDLLLLDEPSNYLDIPTVEYLYRSLQEFKGTMLLISHDRFLLRKLAKSIMEINAGAITPYSGGYDFYRRERENRRLSLEAAKRNSDRKRERLEQMINRFHAKSSKATQVRNWRKMADRLGEISLPDELSFSGKIRFPSVPKCGTPAAEMEHVSFAYPGKPPLLTDVNLRIDNGDKLALVGFNGTGKTTLLKLLVGKLKPDSGRIVLGHNVNFGYLSQAFADVLIPEQSVLDTVRGAFPSGAPQTGLMDVLGAFGFSGSETEKRCAVLSGGEKIRLCFARIFVNPPNFLVLDEPTTHLDIRARELLQSAIQQYAGTVCLVSHDIEFVRQVATSIVAMEPNGPHKYFGGYDYYSEKQQTSSQTTAPKRTRQETAGDPVRERRRDRARRRAALSGEKHRLEQLVSEKENRLAELEQRQSELIALLSRQEETDFAGINRELTAVQREMEQTMREWEENALRLESVLRENARIHED